MLQKVSLESSYCATDGEAERHQSQFVDGAEEQSEDERDENSRTRSDRTDR